MCFLPRACPLPLLCAALLLACETSHEPRELADGGTATADDPCVWSVDELLAQAGLPHEARDNCGMHTTHTLLDAQACFEQKRSERIPVQVSTNKCIDCVIDATYVASGDGRLFEVIREDDALGDDLREAKINQCATVTWSADGQIACASPTELSQCSEPRTDDFSLPL